MLQGYERRHKHTMKQLAWVTSHLLNVSGKSYEKEISIADLLPELEEQPVLEIKTNAEQEEELKKLMEEFGEHG